MFTTSTLNLMNTSNKAHQSSEAVYFSQTEQQLLQHWNQTQADYPKNCGIHHLIESQVERTPDRIAITFEDKTLTYRELNSRANQLARHLQVLGAAPDVLVGIYMQRSLFMVVGLMGILKSGAGYVPLDPAFPQERLAYMIEDAKIPIVLTESSQLPNLPTHQARIICIDKDWQEISQQSQENPNSEVKSDNLAYTIYTSGSTGKPKGVQIIHQAAVNFLVSMGKTPGLTEDDILLAVTTISFDIAVLELYLPLMIGAQICLVSREVAADAARLIEALERSRATVMQATPATWRMLIAGGWQGNAKLKILCGGEAMPRSLADRLLARSASVWNMYGPTETTVWSAVYRVEAGETPIVVGRPIANTQFYIVDPHLRRQSDPLKLVNVGEVGELLIGGDGLARGYLNREDLNAQKFILDPFSQEPGARLYRTGDLARFLSDGNVELIGRIDNQVKIRGFRIELGDIEAALSHHPSIREVAVVAREDNSGEQRLVAYVVADQKLSLVQLRSFLKEKLPEYMVPTTFVVMDSLPLTPNGKVDRRALPEPSQCRSLLEEEFVAPSNPVEEKLAQIWGQVLGIAHIGIYDNFFELGGHSLLTAQLLSQVRDNFGVKLSLTSLFQSPTIAGLAEKIAVAQNSDSAVQSDAVTVAQLKADALLDNSIRPAVPCSKFCSEPQHIFLTGVTGFLGAFLLHELLEQTPATIHCLVRASSLESGKQKIAANLKRYLLSDKKVGDRVVPILGDLAQLHFGLSRQQFDELTAKIDWIYHSGAFVNLIYPYAPLRAANVLGTQEILRLASQVKVKPIHFISTLDVFQSPRYLEMPTILETDDLSTPEGLADGYSQSKWVGEKLVMEANARGIPACIYRPGMISGHSQSGASNTNDTICRLIKGFIQMGSAPKIDMKLSLTPVDYVCQAIVHLSRQPESFGKTFHLATPYALPWQQLVNEIENFGYPIKAIGYKQWQEQLLEVASSQTENVLSPLLFMFTEWGSENQHSYLETTALAFRPFDCRNTLLGLAGTSITCPPLDINEFRAYFSYLIESGFLVAPISSPNSATFHIKPCPH
jgi:amino acid adenylation domain-containing protein/thioester reductase-like protein